MVRPCRQPLTRARRALVPAEASAGSCCRTRSSNSRESKFTAQPVGTFLQPIKLSGALEKVAKKTYIRLPKFPQPAFDKALADCKSDKSWTTFELPDIGHMAMLDAPDRVSELILQGA